MTAVFIGGSRKIDAVSAPVAARIRNMIDGNYEILVGDAGGADAAVQAHLHEAGYRNVTVYCSVESRNNVGGWPLHVVQPTSKRRDFQFFAAKDRALAEAATIGLMLWDGESAGTLMNVKRLISAMKPSVLYLSGSQSFLNIKTPEDFTNLLGNISEKLAKKIASEDAAEMTAPSLFPPATASRRTKRTTKPSHSVRL